MHFYSKDKQGKVEPRYFVPMTKDPTKTRPSRVTDARKAAKSGEVWYPSVTTVLNVLDKPALVNWKVDQHLRTAFEVPEMPQEPYYEWAGAIKRQTQERLDLAPKAGTDIHKVLEDYFSAPTMSPQNPIERLICQNVHAKLELSLGSIDNMECEKYFAENGYAGCADLVVVAQGVNWVIDYKSKQTADKFKPGKMQYPEHSRQLAAYGKAFFKDEPFRAANVFVCLEDGEVDFCEIDHSKLESGYLDFMDCLSIYTRNTYKPELV